MAEIVITPGVRATLLRDCLLYGTGDILGGSVDEISLSSTGLGGRAGDQVIIVSDPPVQQSDRFPGRSFVAVTGAKNPGDVYWVDADAVGAAGPAGAAASSGGLVGLAVVAAIVLIFYLEAR